MGEFLIVDGAFTSMVTTARAQAATLLEVSPNATPEQVRAAFGLKVKLLHPDTAPADALSSDIGGAISKLKKARDLLLATVPTVEEVVNQPVVSTCKLCGGSGRLSTGFGKVCTACGGTGEVLQ